MRLLALCAALAVAGAAAVAFDDQDPSALGGDGGNCELGEWGEWSPCSKLCGRGETRRIRSVAGEGCKAAAQEVKECNDFPCPIDCVTSDWSDWSGCSLNCETGRQARTRKVLSPPRYGGRCPHLREERDCNTQSCGHVEHGIAVVPSWRHEVKCARVDFQAPFLQAPYVVVTLNHRLAPSQPAHAAASAWVEGVHKAGFRVCLAGSDVPTDDIQLDWLAFDRASAASTFFCDKKRVEHGTAEFADVKEDIPTCQVLTYNNRTFSAGTVQVVASHTLAPPPTDATDAAAVAAAQRQGHHPFLVWGEEVNEATFRLCAQGAAAATPDDAAHSAAPVSLRVTWAAYAGEGMPDAQRAALCPKSRFQFDRFMFPSWGGGVKCKRVEFEQEFAKPPTLLYTTGRLSPSGFHPQERVTGWVEDVTGRDFRACVEETGNAEQREDFFVDYLAHDAQ